MVPETVDPLEILNRAVENAKPRLEVKSRRVGGATYQVPLEVAPDRSESLAMRWMINFARKRKGTPDARRPRQRNQGSQPPIRATPSANATTCTRWPRPTAPSPTSAGSLLQSRFFRSFSLLKTFSLPTSRNVRPIRTVPTASIRWSARATSGSPRTLTPGRPR